MGASSSVDLRPEEVEEMTTETGYTPKEIKTLYKRFRRLDRTGKGTISIDDLTMIPEVFMSPVSARLCLAIFRQDGEGRINFSSFAKGLAQFNEKAPVHLKMQGVFTFLDFDGDGLISEGDLRGLLKMMTGESLSPEAADEVVRRTMTLGDLDGDGVISPSDFRGSMSSYPWESLCVPVKESFFYAIDDTA